jgi:site-specific DNA recombinase
MITATRVIGYVRCSTVEQANIGMTLQAQEEMVRSWAQANGAEVVDVVTDGGVSGSMPLAKRPGGSVIAELMRARRHGVQAVVVARLDRLGRDAAETLALLKLFTKGPLALVSVADHLDLTSPEGRAMAGMVCVFAELERSLIAQRTGDALRELRRQGRVYGNTPFGWNRDSNRLVKNAIEQETLTDIRRMDVAGLSYTKIAAQLRLLGRPTKRGGQWEAWSVASVLRTSATLDGLPPPREHDRLSGLRESRRVRPPKAPPTLADYLRRPPYGWQSVDGELLPLPAEQATLRWIRQAQREGISLRAIARLLRDDKCPTRRGGQWDHATVIKILATSERVTRVLRSPGARRAVNPHDARLARQ